MSAPQNSSVVRPAIHCARAGALHCAQAGVAAQGGDWAAEPGAHRVVPDAWGLSWDSRQMAADLGNVGVSSGRLGVGGVFQKVSGELQLLAGSSLWVQPLGQGDPFPLPICGPLSPIGAPPLVDPSIFESQMPPGWWRLRVAEPQAHTCRTQTLSGSGTQPPPGWSGLEGPALVRVGLSGCPALLGRCPASPQRLRGCCHPHHLWGGTHTPEYLRAQAAPQIQMS